MLSAKLFFNGCRLSWSKVNAVEVLSRELKKILPEFEKKHVVIPEYIREFAASACSENALSTEFQAMKQELRASMLGN